MVCIEKRPHKIMCGRSSVSRFRYLSCLLDKDHIKALSHHKKLQEWHKAKLLDKYEDNDWIIGGNFGRCYYPKHFSSRKYKTLLKEANIDKSFTFHDLRHTHASLLLLDGINPKIVQERLGHASIEMTLDTYSHLMPDTQDVAVQAVADFFNKLILGLCKERKEMYD